MSVIALVREHPRLPPGGEAGTKIGSSEPILVPDEEFGRKSWMNAFVSDL